MHQDDLPTQFINSFYQEKHFQWCNASKQRQQQQPLKRKFKTSEQALAFYYELRRINRNLNEKSVKHDFEQLAELLNNLMDYLEYYLSHEEESTIQQQEQGKSNFFSTTLSIQIEKKKQEMIQNYYRIVDERYYGNVYRVKIEDFDCLCEIDLNIYLKISHQSRVDQLLIILEHFKCIYNQYFIVNNDCQLYKYLDLSVKYGNVYENVKYLVYDNSDFKSKVVNYFICRECKTNYNNFKKYKQLKIKIIHSYIESILNRYGTRMEHVNSYVLYLTQCVNYFQSFGHLKNLNKYQKIVPKMIQLLLTRNTHKFKYQYCKLNYSEILNNIGQYDSSMLETSPFLDHSIHPMQIFKYIETQNEMFLLDVDRFIENMADRIITLPHLRKPLSFKKYYQYILYKFGYFNNDLFIDKYSEILDALKQVLSKHVSNLIISKDFEIPILNWLLDLSKKQHLEPSPTTTPNTTTTSISKSDPHWKSHLATLHQFLLSNAYGDDH